MVNGYLLLNRPLDLRRHLLKTFRLYLLTLTWSLITVLCLIKIDGDSYSAWQFIHTVLFLKLGVNNHLWFLFALVSIYLLLPAVKVVYDHPNQRVIWWLLALIFVFSFGD